MPKKVDHKERRERIAAVVLRLTAEDGLDAVTLRDIAAAGGFSMGQVQHYFRSRDDLLMFACAYMVEQTNRRIQAQIEALPEPRTVRALLRMVSAELLPLDEERCAGTRIWLAFLARAVVDPELGTFMRDTLANSHAYFAGLIRAAQQGGELPADLSPDRAATVALSFVDGLVSHVLIGQYGAAEALTAVDDFLDRWFQAPRSA